MSEDWWEIWQERGPLEDLFPVASTDVLGELLDAWPFGAGRFYVFRAGPTGRPGPPAMTLLIQPGYGPLIEHADGSFTIREAP